LDSLFDSKPATPAEGTAGDETKVTAGTTTTKSRSLFSSLFEEPKSELPNSESEPKETCVVTTAERIEESSISKGADKVEITKVYDFAGEIVKYVLVYFK
jgi:hypothetical protein